MATTDTRAASTVTTEPRQGHQWLQQLAGEWTYVGEMSTNPDEATTTLSGTERVRTLGEFWILAEGEGEMPGGGVESSLMTLGYDPRTRRYGGTLVSASMPYLFLYDGELDAQGRVLTLQFEGPSIEGDGTMSTFRDVMEIVSDDHRILTAYVLGNGHWREFMTLSYRRHTSLT